MESVTQFGFMNTQVQYSYGLSCTIYIRDPVEVPFQQIISIQLNDIVMRQGRDGDLSHPKNVPYWHESMESLQGDVESTPVQMLRGTLLRTVIEYLLWVASELKVTNHRQRFLLQLSCPTNFT